MLTSMEAQALDALEDMLHADLGMIDADLRNPNTSAQDTAYLRGKASVYADLLTRKSREVALEMQREANEQRAAEAPPRPAWDDRVRRMLRLRER